MDQATLEMFVAVLLDENENSENHQQRAFEFGASNENDQTLSRDDEDHRFSTQEDIKCFRQEVQQVWTNI